MNFYGWDFSNSNKQRKKSLEALPKCYHIGKQLDHLDENHFYRYITKRYGGKL